MQGTVLGGANNFFSVECNDGITRLCSIKGKVLKSDKEYYNPLAPGDVVCLEADDMNEMKGQISSLVPRKNAFLRWNVKGRCPQLLAANLDYLILVTTPDEPPFRPRFIDRALAQAEHQEITPVIVCNKYDLAGYDPEPLECTLRIWESIGYKVLRVSAKTGEGMTEFAELLEDRLCAFVGQSGVGKSSLINVMDNSCVLKTGSLSRKYGKGSHTTTKGTLLRLTLNESLTAGIKGKKASVIDTPGIRRFVLDDISSENLIFYFREFRPFIGKCEFGMSCSHISERGCAVKDAVDGGIVTQQRYDSWRRISAEIKNGTWAD